MKKLLNLVIILFLLIAITAVNYIILFSLTMKFGIVVGVILISLCFILFFVTIFGLVIGNLKFVMLRSRFEVLGLMALSIFLAIFTGLFTIANATVEYAYKDTDLDLILDNKTRLVASKLFQFPSQKGLVKDKRGGITYFYSSKYEDIADKFDVLLAEEKASFDNLIGDTDLGPLTIEIYDDLDTLRGNSLLDDIGGYYNKFNQTIHLYGVDPNWEQILLHEYTHYRIHQLAKENGLAAVSRLPLWFEEGFAEVMGHGIKTFHHGDVNQVTISDFHLLDFNESFHQARHENLDPYRQGYFAVQHLVNNYETEEISELLLSKTIDKFYENLEDITKKSLATFQQSLLGNLVANQELINEKFILAHEAMDANDYEQAEKILLEIKENGFDHDISLANRQLLNIFLQQDLFDEAITQLEDLIINENYGLKTTDLIQLAAIYLLVDIEKALPTIELAKDEVPDDHWIEPRMEEYVEAYRLINSDTPVVGYRILFDNELLLPEKVRNDLHEKLVLEYPGEF